jgi:hypothetical protein
MISSSKYQYKSDWLKCIKNILDRCGYSNVWISQGNVNPKWLSVSLKQKIFDQFQQKWRSDIYNEIRHQVLGIDINYSVYFVVQFYAICLFLLVTYDFQF